MRPSDRDLAHCHALLARGARTARQNLIRALDLGVGVVGGIPHGERTMADGAASLRDLCEIARRAA